MFGCGICSVQPALLCATCERNERKRLSQWEVTFERVRGERALLQRQLQQKLLSREALTERGQCLQKRKSSVLFLRRHKEVLKQDIENERVKLVALKAGQNLKVRATRLAQQIKELEAKKAKLQDESGPIRHLFSHQRSLVAKELLWVRKVVFDSLLCICPMRLMGSSVVEITPGILFPLDDGHEGIPGHEQAVALGYTAHMLNLMAKYTDVTLPCKPSFYTCRSTILDVDGKTSYPLFMAQSSEEFETALRLLRHDINFLCLHKGLQPFPYTGSTMEHGQTIKQLLLLIRYLSTGSIDVRMDAEVASRGTNPTRHPIMVSSTLSSSTGSVVRVERVHTPSSLSRNASATPSALSRQRAATSSGPPSPSGGSTEREARPRATSDMNRAVDPETGGAAGSRLSARLKSPSQHLRTTPVKSAVPSPDSTRRLAPKGVLDSDETQPIIAGTDDWNIVLPPRPSEVWEDE